MYKLIFKNSFRLGAKNFHFPKYKTFFQSVLFSFFKFGKFCLLKYKEFYRSFCFRSIRKFLKVDFLYFSSMGLKSAGFHFQKYKKSFNLTVRKFYFLKYNEFFGGWNFFFRAWAEKCTSHPYILPLLPQQQQSGTGLKKSNKMAKWQF